MPPPGAACATHRDLPATFTCVRCGSYGCPNCVFAALPQKEICTTCAAPGLGHPIPWEQRKQRGWWRSFWRTIRLATGSPKRFFRTPATEEGALGPALFGILAYTAGQLLSMIGAVGLLCLASLGLLALAPEPETGAVVAGYSLFWMVLVIPLTLLQAPVYGLFGILAGSGFAHVSLVLMKSANAGFESTLRAVSYANAPYVWYAVPCFGPIFGWVWMMGLEVIAIRETHRIGTDRALVAVLGYRIVFALLVVLGYGAIVALAIWAGSMQGR